MQQNVVGTYKILVGTCFQFRYYIGLRRIPSKISAVVGLVHGFGGGESERGLYPAANSHVKGMQLFGQSP